MNKKIMNGIEYYRRKRHMTVKDLSAASHVTGDTIRSLEKHIQDTTSLNIYRRLAEALSVTVDELILEYSCDDLAVGDRPTSRRGDSRCNCIDKYRWEENIPLDELARRMGIGSKERARQVCNMPLPSRKNLLKLAEYENISVDEFETLYAVA